MTQDAHGDRTPAPNKENLTVLSNPFTWRTYEALRIFGEKRGRDLAKLVYMSEASVLQHLRSLEKIGFVDLVDDEVAVRQRVWKARQGGVLLPLLTEDLDYVVEARAWLRVAIETQARVLQDWVEESPQWARDWQEAVEQCDYALLALTRQQLDDLGQELKAVADKWRNVSRQQEGTDNADLQAVYVVTHAVPYPRGITTT